MWGGERNDFFVLIHTMVVKNSGVLKKNYLRQDFLQFYIIKPKNAVCFLYCLCCFISFFSLKKSGFKKKNFYTSVTLFFS